jgi:UDP-2,4-diacetamido-2,4,6-trideoxy-beta-L-altropyranose hydrolase
MISTAFRVDGAPGIGVGHIARCLALADAIAARGGRAHFVCRAHPGHYSDQIARRGHQITLLPRLTSDVALGPDVRIWLGDSSAGDAEATAAALNGQAPDWLIVDHYAADSSWCSRLRASTVRVMAIDDLVDRPLDADLLLNQNADELERNYLDQGLVPSTCRILAGPRYALLRPEFTDSRKTVNRTFGAVARVCVSMGGSDPHGLTALVLKSLASSHLPTGATIDVAFGTEGSWVGAANAVAEELCWPVTVRVGITDMAAWYGDCDLAVGAAGSSSWERCCLGIPSVAIVAADNQYLPARHLATHGAAFVVSRESLLDGVPKAITDMVKDPGGREAMSAKAMALVDGGGVERLLAHLGEATVEGTKI